MLSSLLWHKHDIRRIGHSAWWHICWHRLPWLAKTANIAIDRAQIVLRHSPQIEPWHRRQQLSPRSYAKLFFAHIRDRQAQVRQVRRSPGTLIADGTPLQPLRLWGTTVALRIPSSMAVVATGDGDEVTPLIDALYIALSECRRQEQGIAD